MKPVFQFDLRVPASVVDNNHHVNNVVYVQWMQDAAIRHSDAAGCSQATLALGATWVARSHHIEYLRPAFANDLITVLTWVSNYRKVRTLRRYKFYRASDRTVLARGETDWVLIDIKSGRPQIIPEAIQNLFHLLDDECDPQPNTE